MKIILLQNNNSMEVRTIHKATMVLDGIKSISVNINDLDSEINSKYLLAGAMPVGSVEFVQKAMHVARITEPQNITYPPEILKYLYRKIEKKTVKEVKKLIGKWFIKPVATKTFTGFIFNSKYYDLDYHQDVLENFLVFKNRPDDEMVYVGELVEWLLEYRYYILDGQIIGKARYDMDGSVNAPLPDINIVNQCIIDYASDAPYALDMGVLSSGKTVLVEVNDAWAIGLYYEALTHKQYLNFLQRRWNMLCTQINSSGM